MFYILWAMAPCRWIELTNKYNYSYNYNYDSLSFCVFGTLKKEVANKQFATDTDMMQAFTS